MSKNQNWSDKKPTEPGMYMTRWQKQASWSKKTFNVEVTTSCNGGKSNEQKRLATD